MLITLLTAILALVILIVTYFKWRYNYWQQRGVPFPQPKIPLGNIGNQTQRRQHVAMDIDTIYKAMKSKGHKYAGIYMFDSPIFVPIDINLIKDILTTNFLHFVNRGFYYNEKCDPISAHIISLENERWRNRRSTLTPAFSIGRGKVVYNALLKCGVLLKEEIIKLNYEKVPVNIKDLTQRYIIDTIGDYSFGIECNSIKNPNAEFKVLSCKCFETSINMSALITMLYPKLSKLLGIRVVQKDISDFFMNAIKSIVHHRDTNNIKRPDFINLLMSLRNNTDSKLTTTISLNEIVAESFIFFQAGFETSASTINYCFFELSLNQDIQNKVRKEMFNVMKTHDNKISYEAINEMIYLDMVVQETLRKYPATPLLIRSCNKEYKIPNSDIIIEEGTKLFIPAYSIQRDPDYYPDPEKFDPERFSDEHKSNFNQFTYLPFGEGPRICIGVKFGILHVKMAIITILLEVKVRLNSKTPNKLTFNPNGFTSNSLEDVYLDTELLIQNKLH